MCLCFLSLQHDMKSFHGTFTILKSTYWVPYISPFTLTKTTTVTQKLIHRLGNRQIYSVSGSEVFGLY